MFSYNTWSSGVLMEPGMINPRKKFAVAAVNGKIYISGGACRSNAVEEYDPCAGKWMVVGSAPRKRYGCIGASVDGVFYVIGGLKIGLQGGGSEANSYPSSMDLYDVKAREWLKSQSVPGGGCIVAACGAGCYLYVLASHAVELSFWRFNGCRSDKGYKEWRRIDAPPMPAQVRVDSSVRFSCIGIGEKVMLIQVMGCIDDLLRRSGRIARGLRKGWCWFLIPPPRSGVERRICRRILHAPPLFVWNAKMMMLLMGVLVLLGLLLTPRASS